MINLAISACEGYSKYLARESFFSLLCAYHKLTHDLEGNYCENLYNFQFELGLFFKGIDDYQMIYKKVFFLDQKDLFSRYELMMEYVLNFPFPEDFYSKNWTW